MIAATITGVGLRAPGLVGWTASLPVLRGISEHRNTPMPQVKPALLPAGERRRTTPLVRLALAAAEDAMSGGFNGGPPIASVFASSGGDLDIVDRICDSLKMADRPVSPTHFHNSVHNAPAGYWAIATDCRKSSVSLSAYDGTFAAGLIEALSMVHVEGAAVLLVAYDQPGPPPFQGHRSITQPFAVAFVLAPDEAEGRLARVSLARVPVPEPLGLSDTSLERLRCTNPAARSLPLLIAIAGGRNRLFRLTEDVSLAITVDVAKKAAS